ncbi:MAG: glycosyltransferase [Planctomycetia bacterium]|nr:glycosyltransferase [Planctomycetia bacterium]
MHNVYHTPAEDRGNWLAAATTHGREATAQAAALSTKPFRVRTIGRFDACAAPGGGEVQLMQTTAGLREAGLDARLWRPWEDSLNHDVDLLHFFGSRQDFLPLVEAARRNGKRVALSTIAWFDWRNAWRESAGWLARGRAAARYAVRAALPGLSSWRRRLYHTADLLLPNSQSEAEQLMRLFEVPAEKIRVVPNGFDERFALADDQAFTRRFGLRDFVLCVGRIEPRKNQLGLIRALRNSGQTLVILGDVVPGHEKYAATCRHEADSNVHFLGALGHNDPLLASAYAACRCLTLVGWYETPGLAALEAAATGTPLVLPRGGCAEEYFGPHAEYVLPHDLKQIHSAVLRAIERPRSAELSRLVADSFTWKQVAVATRAAYELQ